MPDRVLERWPRLKRWAWPFTIGLLFALTISTATLAVTNIILNGQLNAAEKKIAGLEAAGAIAEVATCYGSARINPPLIEILEDIAPGNALIKVFANDTPTVAECNMLARDRGLNPKDFPAPEIPPSP